ncbi:MAG: spore coat protein CotJB [Clostridia bacterium]|nr:spore coat protein CotJB [Clostridia bacterium]
MLKKLQALDFSIYETVLYLDAYPNSADALSYYHKLVAERDALQRALAETCRMPITNLENASVNSWDWVNGPWPWEASAN